ncbi:MAG: hypothetical protein LBD46_08565 [Endomicrobium sp.]|jgi:hypothetical protein|nr:hypothetical protein [Endomicrobium sp.]
MIQNIKIIINNKTFDVDGYSSRLNKEDCVDMLEEIIDDGVSVKELSEKIS